MSDGDLLFSNDDMAPLKVAPAGTPWTVLIVDDDPEVHMATRLVLSDVTCLDRPINLLSAYSGRQARELLPQLRDVAVILLDVVMETDDSGLQLVRHVRDTLNMQTTRIILRTGQPGSAPEREVITHYDINDYKAKTELTEARLFTTVYAALRSYRHLVSLELSRRGLRHVIEAAASLHKNQSLQQFAEGVLMQLTAILDSEAHSVLCTHRRDGKPGSMMVLAGSGRFTGLASDAASLESGHDINGVVSEVFAKRCSLFNLTHAALYLRTPTEREVVVYVEKERPFSELDLSLLELFGHNISIGYDNLEMYQQLHEANASLESRVIERTRALISSEAELRRFKSAVEHSSASILITDPAGVITYANPALAAASQYPAAEMLGQQANIFKSGLMPEATYQAMWARIMGGESWRGELLNRRKNGDHYWEDVSISPVNDETGALVHFVAIRDDISERKKLEQELRRMATVDPLTGALNRRSFFDLAEQELSRWARHFDSLSALMFDVDHFKSVNDTYGHQGGDEALRAIAAACRKCLRERDIMGRLGGEEFACVMPETSAEQAMVAAERLRRAIGELKIRCGNGREIKLTVSVGVATLGEADRDIDAVLHRADVALYAAKQSGRNCIRQMA